MNCFSGFRIAAWISSSALAISAFGQNAPPPPDYSNDPQYSQQAYPDDRQLYPDQPRDNRDSRERPAYSDDRQPYPDQPRDDRDFRDRPAYERQAPVPAQLQLRPGTFVSVRLDQPLSSNRNHQGDTFSATLVRPVVVDGIVVAEPGEMVAGRVVEALHPRRAEGPARLGVALTDLTLADGTQIPVQSQLVSRTAPGSLDRDAGTILGATALGAAIGGAADWGTGALIGATAGLAASTIGVLVTPGRPSVLYPETVLTFRIQSPAVISTVNAPGAFHAINPRDYEQYDRYRDRPQPRRMVALPPAYYYPRSYYGGFGPGFGYFSGPTFYGRFGYGGRRWRR